MELPASEAASSVHDGVESREPSVLAADQAFRPPRPTQEHNKSGLAWLGPDPCSGHGPLGVPTRPPPQPPAQKLVLWTAPPILGRRK